MKLPITLNSSHRLFTSQLSQFPFTSITLTNFKTSKSFAFFSFPNYPKPLFSRLCRRATMAVTASATSQRSVAVKERIDLTDKEKQIFDRLLQVHRHFNLQTHLRVAGGWVRDKVLRSHKEFEREVQLKQNSFKAFELLGKECYDIDIALDDMLGREFCEKVNEYLLTSGEETQGIGVIQCNPEQSKHLETARMRIFNVWIDFVNLRSEDYSESSRIPTMRFGTAKEDAYRRDLTINSLFYNINSGSVEDFTGRGIVDLKSGKIVTPLPPMQTFLDDPLRVLRAIRFGARFEFELVEELKKAASDDNVRAAIAEKISRERIGHEIDLMISGNQPVKAMTYVFELRLFWAVFSLPLEFEPSISDQFDRNCVAYMEYAWLLVQMIGCSFSEDQRRLCLYAALLFPFKETIYRDKKSKKIPVASYIVRNSLKLKASDAEMVTSLHVAAQKFVSLIPFIMEEEDIQYCEVDWKKETIDVPVASKLRILAGLVLRDIKEFWQAAVVLAVLLYPIDIGYMDKFSDEHLELEKRKELYKRIEDAILKQGLEKVWEVKPLVNGNELMEKLNVPRGPLVRQWQQKQLEWQLAHPFGTAEDCICWMTETHSKRARME